MNCAIRATTELASRRRATPQSCGLQGTSLRRCSSKTPGHPGFGIAPHPLGRVCRLSLPPALPTIPLEHRPTGQTLLLHRKHLADIRLSNQTAVAELVQRFPKASNATLAISYGK